MNSEFNGEKPLPILPDELCLSMAESYLQQKAALKAKLNLKETSPWQTTPKAIQNVATQLKALEVRPAKDLNLRNGLRLLKIRQKEQAQQSLQIMPQVPEVAKRPVSEFGQAVRPLAQAARDAHRIIKTNEASKLKSAQASFSFNTSQIISRVNALRIERAVQEGTLDAKETNSIVIPQIQAPRPSVSYRADQSPVLPHNDLWPLPIYRNPDLNPRFMQHLITASKRLSPDGQKTQLVLAVGRTLSRHLTEGPWNSVPTDFRDRAKVTLGVTEVAQWISQFEAQTLPIPTAAELGRPNTEQLRHTESYMIAILAAYLLQELKNPQLTEKELRRLYQGFSNEVGRAAEWIGKRGDEMVCQAIDNLPPVAGVLVISRLSTERYTQLGFPCNLFMSEVRMAEVLSNAGYKYNFRFRYPPEVQETTGYNIQVLVGCLEERMEQGDISTGSVFTILEKLPYGDSIIKGLFEGANPEGKEILLQTLGTCSNFRQLRQQLQLRLDEGEY